MRGVVPVGLVALFACGRPAVVPRASHLRMRGVTFTKFCIERSVRIHGELVAG